MATDEATRQFRAETVRIWLGKMCSPSTTTVFAAEDCMFSVCDHTFLPSAPVLRETTEVNTKVQETGVPFPFGAKAAEFTSDKLHMVTAAQPTHGGAEPQPGSLRVS